MQITAFNINTNIDIDEGIDLGDIDPHRASNVVFERLVDYIYQHTGLRSCGLEDMWTLRSATFANPVEKFIDYLNTHIDDSMNIPVRFDTKA